MVGRHLLSIDVEHWYDATLAAKPAVPEPDFARREIDAVLEMLAAHGARATFFVLGSLAEDLPDSVRAIAAAGHEIGCHGYTHELVWRLGEDTFRQEVKRARAILQDLTGQAVLGYRAATWSIDHRTPWAPAVLGELGFTYDSSVFPMRTPLYGVAGAPTAPYLLVANSRSIVELPPAVSHIGPLRMPVGGGIYWRILPSALVAAALGEAAPRVLYIHPWEIIQSGWSLPSTAGLSSRLSMQIGRRRLFHTLAYLLGHVMMTSLGELASAVSTAHLDQWGFHKGILTSVGH